MFVAVGFVSCCRRHPSASYLLFSYLTVAEYDKFGRRQFFQTHRAESVDLARADADLGAKTEFAAVVEAGRSIDHHRRRIYPLDEFPGFLVAARDDAFGVFRTVALDMLDRLVHVLDYTHGEHQIEIFLRPIRFRRRLDVRRERLGFLAAANLHARRLKFCDHDRSEEHTSE